jgi:hypothetical protein
MSMDNMSTSITVIIEAGGIKEGATMEGGDGDDGDNPDAAPDLIKA